jgi:1,4-alpha-glucan branching enzyme
VAPFVTAEGLRGQNDSAIRNFLLSCYVAAIASHYDVVHLHDRLSVLGLASLPTGTGARTPLVATFHSAALARLMRHPYVAAGQFARKYSTLLLSEKLTARGAEQVIAVSKAVAAELVTLYNIPRSKITVIPNGIDSSQFALLEKAGCKAALGVPVQNRIVLFFGRLDELKGIHVLLDAFSTLARSDVELHIAGTGPLAGWVRECAAGNPRIRYHGFVEPQSRLKQVLACAADAFVSPSFYEGLPYGVLEMMAWQRPLVLSDIPSHREVAFGLAEFFEPGRSESLAQAFDRVLGDDLDLPRADCLMRVQAGYSLEVQNQLTLQVYQDVRHR